ncbi:hypothetical protein HYH02_012388 [Chlamydomonas schloesseri]|uniref:ZIP family transporter n=1 Tax=Chlamydomonas schloesseri TaxID=2026947 RepID=A0A835T1X3_9CHLO|nr:hypothetical protein HYH02_012388 [Chlamydomonas schloesseri]|eukprot:KAG2434373.1 hypothetical protein HYH02_012388 [Chlamydomonas schloesseri]
MPGPLLAPLPSGTLNGVSGGMLLYISLVQLVAEDMGRFVPGGGVGGGGEGGGAGGGGGAGRRRRRGAVAWELGGDWGIILVAGLSGALPPLFMKAFRNHDGLASQVSRSLAAGVILALALVHIIPEAIEDMSGLGGLTYPLGGLCVLGGVALMLLLEHLSQILHNSQAAVAAAAATGGCGHSHGSSSRGRSGHERRQAASVLPPRSSSASSSSSSTVEGCGNDHNVPLLAGMEADGDDHSHDHGHHHHDGHGAHGGGHHANDVEAPLTPEALRGASGAPGAPGAPAGGQHALLGAHLHAPAGECHEAGALGAVSPTHHHHHQLQLQHAHGPQQDVVLLVVEEQPLKQRKGEASGDSDSGMNRSVAAAAAAAATANGHSHDHGHSHGHNHKYGKPHPPPHQPDTPQQHPHHQHTQTGVASYEQLPPPQHQHTCVTYGNAPSLLTIAVGGSGGEAAGGGDAAAGGLGGGSLRLRLLAYMFELGCVFHSLIIGVAVGVITEDVAQVRALLIALSFHQWLEGLGLGSVIARGGFSRSKAAAMAAFYSLTCPAGVGAGMALARLYDAESEVARGVQGTLNGVSGGMLLYISLVQLVAEDMGRFVPGGGGVGGGGEGGGAGGGGGAGRRLLSFAALCGGAGAMCLLAVWT